MTLCAFVCPTQQAKGPGAPAHCFARLHQLLAVALLIRGLILGTAHARRARMQRHALSKIIRRIVLRKESGTYQRRRIKASGKNGSEIQLEIHRGQTSSPVPHHVAASLHAGFVREPR